MGPREFDELISIREQENMVGWFSSDKSIAMLTKGFLCIKTSKITEDQFEEIIDNLNAKKALGRRCYLMDKDD